VIYAVVYMLAPLEEKNLFLGVKDALDKFSTVKEAIESSVRTDPSFTFAGYFWENRDKDRSLRYTPTLGAKPAADVPEGKKASSLADRWVGIVQDLHEETLRMDESFRHPRWQGLNARVAVVCESGRQASHEPKTAVCLHYRRLGKCGFVAAVDEDEQRVMALNQRFNDTSQALFQRLVEGVGRLVNIRESLK
jgi:hypothetical protein